MKPAINGQQLPAAHTLAQILDVLDGRGVEAIVRALKRNGYQGLVSLEPHVSEENVLKFHDIEIPYLKKLLAI